MKIEELDLRPESTWSGFASLGFIVANYRRMYVDSPMALNAAFRRPALAALATAAFLSQCLAVLPLLGIQNDEAVVANGIFPPAELAYSWQSPWGNIPLMLVSYAGSLKTWLYYPILKLCPAGPISLRLPMVLAGAGALWLTILWVKKLWGIRAATFTGLLLAFDPAYVLTATFDWGPVALQRLLMAAAMYFLVQFGKTSTLRNVALGTFCIGLGIWDKALFLWLLAGVTVATVLVYRRALQSALAPQIAAAGVTAGLLGMLPFLAYNISTRGGTFRGNAEIDVDLAQITYKTKVLFDTLDGNFAFGYMTRKRDLSRPVDSAPSSKEQSRSSLVDRINQCEGTLFPYVFAICIAMIPFVRSSHNQKGAIWALIAFMVAFLLIVIGRDVGGGAHHSVLLWPLPHLIVALVLDDLVWNRTTTVSILIASCLAPSLISGIAVTTNLARVALIEGTSAIWTDAIYRLHERLAARNAEKVFVLDWGVLDTLRLLGRGELPLEVGVDPFFGPPSQSADEKYLQYMFADPEYVFVTHTIGNELLPGTQRNFQAVTRGRGLEKFDSELVHDRRGRPIFELFRIRPIVDGL